MFSAGYILIALIDFALLVWAIRLYKQYPSTALWLAAAPLTLMWYDNLVIATSYIGPMVSTGTGAPRPPTNVRIVH